MERLKFGWPVRFSIAESFFLNSFDFLNFENFEYFLIFGIWKFLKLNFDFEIFLRLKW